MSLSSKNISGFTLVELMIVVAIATVIISTALYQYVLFNDKLSLSSSAQEVALIIREAQTQSISSKINPFSIFVTADHPYGIAFRSWSALNSEYYLFSDDDGNNFGSFSACNSFSECKQTFQLRNGIKINCVGSVGECPNSPTTYDLAVLFRRPSTDAFIYKSSTGSAMGTGVIQLVSSTGRSINIILNSTGQIYIQEEQ
ncbi:MAG TPA: prepilin-type N-terminal cleavage/methylation domain-containing protein [Candidatus Paceibacterota bacterium]